MTGLKKTIIYNSVIKVSTRYITTDDNDRNTTVNMSTEEMWPARGVQVRLSNVHFQHDAGLEKEKKNTHTSFV